MATPSYRRHRFPPEIIQHAIWLYLRFTLSYLACQQVKAENSPLQERFTPISWLDL
jgi:putative transposase